MAISEAIAAIARHTASARREFRRRKASLTALAACAIEDGASIGAAIACRSFVFSCSSICCSASVNAPMATKYLAQTPRSIRKGRPLVESNQCL